MAEREGLIARVRQVRRLASAADAAAAGHSTVEPQDDRILALQARVAHLEQLLEALQDFVHRESH